LCDFNVYKDAVIISCILAYTTCNVPHGWAGHLRQDLTKNYPTSLQIATQQQQDNLLALRESRLQLALQAIEREATLSQRCAAKIYNVPNVGAGDSLRSATRSAEHHMPTYKDKAVQPRAIDIITRSYSIVVNKALQLF
jgi:hypothetical protein